VRWEALFGDLEAQLEAAAAADLAIEVRDETLRAVGAIGLVARLRAAASDLLTVGLLDGTSLRGTVRGVGPDWLLLEDTTEALVSTAAIAWVQGLGRRADVSRPGVVWERLGLRAALRGIARDRSAVRLSVSGSEPLTGTLDRVGADHVDVAVHPLDVVRRAEEVLGVRTVSLTALLAVTRC
jgi:hypothetical protein